MRFDKQIADLCLALYADAPQGFDDLLWPEADDGVCCALKRLGDTDVVVFRGSTTIEDWLRDFLAIPHETETHPQLGDVHAGFMLGMDDAFAHLFPLLREKVIVTGHSLGAGRAALFMGLLATRLPDVDASAVLFGEPRSGCGRLQRLLADRKYRSYRNASKGGHDLITDLPTDPPYCRNRPLLDVSAPPPPGDPWGPFAFHHMELYQRALS